MSDELTSEDLGRIQAGIREKYKAVAAGPGGHFSYPTGREGLTGLHYDPQLLRRLPDSIAASYCGVGNPLSLGDIRPGDSVLDIGCGAGVDALLAGLMVGEAGSVLGIDLTPEMVARADENQRRMAAGNVSFRVAGPEDLDPGKKRFDIAISNGVFNLIPDKESAIAAVFRLLEPGGRLFLADQFLKGTAPKHLEERVATWFQWEGGAVPETEFLAALERAGFEDVERVSETGYDSSPKTRGVTLRARKPPRSASPNKELEPGDAGAASGGAFTAGTVEDLLARSFALGAESAKIIDTGTVAVEKWVKWKCMYGCPMYAKDGYHPPATPDPEEVREVLGEYSRAILLGGRDGRFLSEVACRLEGEAYRSGFYKAFALIALPPGPESGTAPGGTWPTGGEGASCRPPDKPARRAPVRPMMEACGIDVFKTARRNGFNVVTPREHPRQLTFLAMVLIE